MIHGHKIILDAHSLIWYYHQESNIKLSQNAFTAIVDAERNGIIFVSVVALMEILCVLEKGKYPIIFDEMLQDLTDSPVYNIVPLTAEIVGAMSNLPDMELHDRAIVATAIFTASELVSSDIEISKIYNRVIW